MFAVKIFITLIISAGLSAVVIAFFLKRSSAQASKSFGKERDVLKAESQRFDSFIQRAVDHVSSMISLDEVATLEQKKVQVQTAVAEEHVRVKKVEGELEALQSRVDRQEAKHNELKKGKEDSERLADDLRANKEILIAEAQKLEVELDQSKTQMDTLASEVELSTEQNEALEEITGSMTKMGSQLKELVDLHTQSAQRFLNLQKQFSELEKEFRKLVDKELSGKP